MMVGGYTSNNITNTGRHHGIDTARTEKEGKKKKKKNKQNKKKKNHGYVMMMDG